MTTGLLLLLVALNLLSLVLLAAQVRLVQLLHRSRFGTPAPRNRALVLLDALLRLFA